MSRTVRLFIAGLAEGEAELDEAAAHYLSRVHRLGAGARFVAFDPERAFRAECELLSVGKSRARYRVIELARHEPERLMRCWLMQGLGKGERAEQVVSSATALGVERILLVESERGVVRLGGRADARLSRLRSVSIEAARQSERDELPRIEGPLGLAAALALPELPAARFCLDPRAELPLLSAAERLCADTHEPPLALLIGPEGGLSEAELGAADGAGFVRVTLAPWVLRTELAPIAALGALNAWLMARRQRA